MKLKYRTFYQDQMHYLDNINYVSLEVCKDFIDKDKRKSLEYSSVVKDLEKVCLKNKMVSTLNKTKSGEEIYEGDILELEDGKIGFVLYVEDYGGFVVEWCKEKFNKPIEGDFMRSLNCDVAYTSKLLGNVYENPELRSNCLLSGDNMKGEDFDIYF